jgi:DoxX-like protein
MHPKRLRILLLSCSTRIALCYSKRSAAATATGPPPPRFSCKLPPIESAAIALLTAPINQEGLQKSSRWYMRRSDLCRWAILPMRFLVGYGFMEHGVAKLLRGPDVFAGILQELGLPLPHVAAWLTISTEILGGLAVLLGALVSWASIPLLPFCWSPCSLCTCHMDSVP